MYSCPQHELFDSEADIIESSTCRFSVLYSVVSGVEQKMGLHRLPPLPQSLPFQHQDVRVLGEVGQRWNNTPPRRDNRRGKFGLMQYWA